MESLNNGTIRKNSKYCIYLRKSRRDDVAQDDAEVLARHEAILREYAAKIGINIDYIYSEGVRSGDSIASRPVMQQLLSDVDAGMWAGVMVTEFSRLARGNVRDQGEVLEAFGLSGTLIITPDKTYDLSDENDETFSELGLMMARQEYKAICRRLQAGRIRSAKDGRYQGSIPPFGYDKIRLENCKKACTLVPNDAEAKIVRLIFDLCTQENLGTSGITGRLNRLQIPSRKGTVWTVSTVKRILTNPVYIGMITWNRRKIIKRREDGVTKNSRPIADKSSWLMSEGLHPAIIKKEQFDDAQRIVDDKALAFAPLKKSFGLQNPFAGLAVCGKCGHKMVRKSFRSNAQPSLICTYHGCSNASSVLSNVEESLLKSMAAWLDEYKLNIKNGDNSGGELAAIDRAEGAAREDLQQVNGQESRLQDLLEQGVYDINTYIIRHDILKDRRQTIEKKLTALKEQRAAIVARDTNSIIPKMEQVLSVYPSLQSADEKNKLLKTVLEKFEYTRENAGKWAEPWNFELKIYPKL